jgi:hypothetical protein
MDLIAMSQVTKVSKVTFMCLCNGSSEAFRSLKNSSTEPEELRWHQVMAWPGSSDGDYAGPRSRGWLCAAAGLGGGRATGCLNLNDAG